MDVRICGPNLSSEAQSKGSLHVHRADCKDLNYYGPGRKYGGDTHGTRESLLKKATIKSCVYHVFDNGILDEAVANGDGTELEVAQMYESEFWFAPCCGTLPGGWEELEKAANDHQPTGPAANEQVVYECWVNRAIPNRRPHEEPSSFRKLHEEDIADWLVNALQVMGTHDQIHISKHLASEYTQ